MVAPVDKQAADTRVLVQIDWDRYLVLRDDQPNQPAEILLMVRGSILLAVKTWPSHRSPERV